MTAPDRAALLALAGQVERLTDGDRSVDAAIEEAIGPLGEKPGAHLLSGAPSREAYLYAAAGYYTSAPAAALGLVERVMPKRQLGLIDKPSAEHCMATICGEVGNLWERPTGRADGWGKDKAGRFARAMTAAVLRAMAEPGDG